jgi:hypothetical protein
VLLTTGLTRSSIAQNSDDLEEVALNFRYSTVVNTFITVLYDGEQFYFPTIETLQLLRIVHTVQAGNGLITGYYIDENRPFRIDFKSGIMTKNRVQYPADVSQFHIRDLDFYLSQKAFDELFDAESTVDFSSLTLRVITQQKLPVLSLLERTMRREQMLRSTTTRPDYPLAYSRNRELLNGFFVDYSVNKSYSTHLSYAQVLNMGGELFGGDLQGAHIMTSNVQGTSSEFNSLRWRYSLNENRALSQILAGQLNSSGQITREFYGLRLSNDRILPRRSFDTFRYAGQADPQSEVEIYINNQLVDFQIASEFGEYQTDLPLNFGSSDIRIVTISPSGAVSESTRRLQIPFTFLPKGEFIYNLDAGQYKRNLFPGTEMNTVVQGNMSYGLSNTMTLKTGFDLIEEDSVRTLWYNQLSVRLFDQYLVSANIAPNAYYGINTSVLYANGTSVAINATEYIGYGIYNLSRFDRNVSTNIFLPFYQTRIPFGVRYSLEYLAFDGGKTLRHYGELNLRIARINLKTGYRLSTFERGENSFQSGRVITSATYTFARSFEVPSYLRGTFLRGQFEYDQQTQRIELVDVQYSKQVMRNARVDVSVGRNIAQGINTVQIGFIMDFNFARSTSRMRFRGTQATLSHNIRGSVGYDPETNYFNADFRQQVGRAGASVRMFIDANENGLYDEGETIIDDPAIRMSRVSASQLGRDGIFRFSQLQQYEQYHVDINKAAISNPMLVPKQRQFSFIADPNQYKNIDVPFYYSGILEGKVVLRDGSAVRELGGLRLYLQNVETGEVRETRTYSDGAFYLDEVEPGNYRLYPDPNQLTILDAISEQESLDIQVRASSEGDFIDGLNLTLIKNIRSGQ